MIKLSTLLKTLLAATVLLLAACNSISVRYEQQSTDNLAGTDSLPADTQDEFEDLLSRLNEQGMMFPQASNAMSSTANSAAVKNTSTSQWHTSEVKSRLLHQYDRWKGVRYRLGGDSRRGIDCSAFVQRTFLEQFGVDLPRSTHYQQKLGTRISRDKLRTGDLVLFKSGSTGRHVGIYIGNNQFVHASTRKGVIISSMDNPYWKSRYNEARRILTSG